MYTYNYIRLSPSPTWSEDWVFLKMVFKPPIYGDLMGQLGVFADLGNPFSEGESFQLFWAYLIPYQHFGTSIFIFWVKNLRSLRVASSFFFKSQFLQVPMFVHVWLVKSHFNRVNFPSAFRSNPGFPLEFLVSAHQIRYFCYMLPLFPVFTGQICNFWWVETPILQGSAWRPSGRHWGESIWRTWRRRKEGGSVLSRWLGCGSSCEKNYISIYIYVYIYI